MNVLVTNDDGIFSEGLKLLAEALGELGRVVVVAPDREQSASGHSLTLHRPLRIRQVREHWYAVDGTPTDCVNLAVQGLLKEEPPDVVASGINVGLNLGNDVTYSGTVSATFEARLQKLPAIAFSQEVAEGCSFERAADFARRLLATLIDDGLPSDLHLNVNFPAGPYRGVRLGKLARRYYRQTVVAKTDPRGRTYYWIGGEPEWEEEPGTDQAALSQGYVSITPLHLDLTDYAGLERYRHLAGRLAPSPAAAE
ncbi:MAG: 5'/3'-nucleotidase SurE [Acidobacteria bacterium]|nr:MAG: 5'/3'-nucleotidase SurE [Acidobacteriota bacterium]